MNNSARPLLRYFICLLFASLSFGARAQKVIDTTVQYNGRQAKQKIYFDKDGQKMKEVTFYESGKIEEEHFYSEGKDLKWVTYDSTGVQNSEWYSPDVERARYNRLRNEILLLTGMILSLLIGLSWKFISYKVTYYILTPLAIIVPVISFLLSPLLDKSGDVTGFIVGSIVIELPVILFILSVRNLIKKTDIFLFMTVFNLVVTVILMGLFAISILMASIGGGIIG